MMPAVDTSPSSPSPRWALVTGAAAAVGASLCCVVPLVLVSLVSAAPGLRASPLEPYRPWFAALALTALIVAGWRLYGPASRCKDGTICGTRGSCVADAGYYGLRSRSSYRSCSFLTTSRGLFRSTSC